MSAEFVLDTPVVRAFVADVQAAIARASAPEEACEEIRPAFAALLADQNWLPGEYQAAAPESGMGGGIGQWLLHRAGDGSLSLFSLVVPPGSETPIHDHLAWGLVGLYRGTQDEEIYAQRHGALELRERRSLRPGDFYVLIPPRDDIHRVRTTSSETSVSIHLLTNDTGCVWRHAYDAESGEARPFRSGYVNASCDDGASTQAIFFETPAELRAWLEEHHATANEVWVGYYKKASGRRSLTWSQVVDEALCFGWIDGKVQRIDEHRYRQRLTPRRRGSNWSDVNVAKVAELRAQGRMTPAGEEAFATRRETPPDALTWERRHEAAFDEEQEARFRAGGPAWTWFQAQRPAYRAMATFWVVSAKRPETRERRLSTLIECSAEGRRVPALEV